MRDIQNLFSLKDKKVLVTGASSGIGRRFAKVLASVGAQVLVAARRGDLLRQLVSEIDSQGGKAISYELDLAENASIDHFLSALKNDHDYVDIVINNAGIGKLTPLDFEYRDRSRKIWDLTIPN